MQSCPAGRTDNGHVFSKIRTESGQQTDTGHDFPEDPDKDETRTGHEQCCPPTSGLKQEVQSLIFRLLFLRWLLRWVKSPLETALFNIRFLLRSSRSILFCRLIFLFAARSILIFSLFKCRTSVGDFAISHLASISIKHTKITKI